MAQERYQQLSVCMPDEWRGSCPVEIDEYALLLDTQEKQCVLRVVFRNVCDDRVQAVHMLAYCLDSEGVRLGDIAHAYQDIDAPPAALFGGKVLLPLESDKIADVRIIIKRVALDRGVPWLWDGHPPQPLPPQQRMDTLPWELLAQYERQLEDSEYAGMRSDIWLPALRDEYWQCCCGRAEPLERYECGRCGMSRDWIFANTDPAFLRQHLQQESKASRERWVDAVQEEQTRADRSAARKKKWRALWKRRKNGIIILGCGMVVAIMTAVVVLCVLGGGHSQEYKEAMALAQQGNTLQAMAAFRSLSGDKEARQGYAEVSLQNVLSAGSDFSVGLRREGNVAVAGNAAADGRIALADWRGIVSLDAGDEHTVAVCADGKVVASGQNDNGRCDVAAWKNIIAVSAGSNHTLGLLADGSVVAAGYDAFGRCDVGGWSQIVAIGAGSFHSVGLHADGKVSAVGQNDDGQCNVSEWNAIVAVSAGNFHTVGLREDGSVVAVGYNQNGQCEVADWRDIVAITAGSTFTLGLKVDGSVVATGSNTYGQCDVADWTDILAVCAGRDHVLGLRGDGSVLAVGSDLRGQCDLTGWQNIGRPDADALKAQLAGVASTPTPVLVTTPTPSPTPTMLLVTPVKTYASVYTKAPTQAPTVAPIKTYAPQPTVKPTTNPTAKPTPEPPEPTVKPTPEPPEPTVKPTPEPPEPTVKSTPEPPEPTTAQPVESTLE